MQIACVIVPTPRCMSDGRALEERLFTPNASATKPQAHGNRAVNELGCHWLRTSVTRERDRETERERDGGRSVMKLLLAILSRSSEYSVKSDRAGCG